MMEEREKDELIPAEQENNEKKKTDNVVLVVLMTAAGMLLGYMLGRLFLDMPVLRFLAALIVGGIVGGAFSRLLKK